MKQISEDEFSNLLDSQSALGLCHISTKDISSTGERSDFYFSIDKTDLELSFVDYHRELEKYCGCSIDTTNIRIWKINLTINDSKL